MHKIYLMNIYKRRQASGKKAAGGRGFCTVLPDYERDYGQRLAQNASYHDPVPRGSISPSRFDGRSQGQLSSHNLMVPQSQGLGEGFASRQEAVGAAEQYILAK